MITWLGTCLSQGKLIYPISFLVLVVIPVVAYVLLGKWNETSEDRKRAYLLVQMAAEEALRAESLAAVDGFQFVVPSKNNGLHTCAMCLIPATTRCSRCKSVRYCSAKCQIIHWRQSHRDECVMVETRSASSRNSVPMGDLAQHAYVIDSPSYSFDVKQVRNVTHPSRSSIEFSNLGASSVDMAIGGGLESGPSTRDRDSLVSRVKAATAKLQVEKTTHPSQFSVEFSSLGAHPSDNASQVNMMERRNIETEHPRKFSRDTPRRDISLKYDFFEEVSRGQASTLEDFALHNYVIDSPLHSFDAKEVGKMTHPSRYGLEFSSLGASPCENASQVNMVERRSTEKEYPRKFNRDTSRRDNILKFDFFEETLQGHANSLGCVDNTCKLKEVCHEKEVTDLLYEETTIASSSSPQQYDVFLSFRGIDTRKKFVSHLYQVLLNRGISTFKDDRELCPSDSLSSELPKAIKESKFAIVIISKNYASSSWCLKELEMIMELKRKGTIEVVPIFYEVDPSNVRKQKETFADALLKLEGIEKLEKVNKWREALTEVANLTGVVSQEWQEEAAMIHSVVGNISRLLFFMLSKDTTDIIGMDTQLEALGPLSSLVSDDEVCMIGIWGMGGVGKTTIAKYLYNKFSCQFSFRCFIENTKKIYAERGLDNLRRQFLFQILSDENLLSSRVQLGSNLIEKRLSGRKILAILDDVDNLEQLEALAKHNSWFGPGSLIIITTRDKGLLLSRELKLVHVKCLEQNVAYGFFNHFAFGEAFSNGQVPNGFERLAARASALVGGLPLALKVLGLFLRGRKTGEWEIAIRRLRDDPREAVMKCLKVSYDGLTKENQDIFLNVACLFNEEHASHVSQCLVGEEKEVRDSLHKLAEKALIDISSDGKVIVHDLIHELAKDIVNNEPGRRRFLVDSNEIRDVLTEGTGTNAVEAIEGISLDMAKISYFPMGSKGFENMRNLRYLKIHNTYCSSNNNLQILAAINHLPRGLRMLDWRNCPLTVLPSTFDAKFLVELRLPYGEIEKLSERSLSLGNLRRIDLSRCYKLEEILSLYKARKLEKLDLSFCLNLVKFPSSFLHMEKLTYLSMRRCTRLKFLPELPKSIVELYMSRTSITEVPESIQNLVALEVLDLSDCRKLSRISSTIGNLTALKTLDLSGCVMLSAVPSTIGNLRSIKELHLDNCKSLVSIPDSVMHLTGLKDLKGMFRELITT